MEKKKNIIKNEEGSTLVELLIALSIFAIFISVAIGGFLQSLSNQRVVLKLVAATDNMSLTLEQIMREMRVGTNFLSSGSGIQFDKYDDDGSGTAVKRTINYSWEQAPWDPTKGKHAIFRSITDFGGSGGTAEPITADNVDVSYFSVEANKEHTPGPCRINITIGVSAHDKSITINNYIQTTVSSRVFSDTCE